MVKDKIITGVIIGILADAIKLTVNYIGYLFNFTPVIFWQITASKFLGKKDLFKPLAYLIGAAADITVTALLGIVFVYFVYYLGSRHLWIKGIGFGLAVWVVLLGTLLGQAAQKNFALDPPAVMITLVAHSVFGLALAFFTWLLELRRESGSGPKGHRYRITKPGPLK